MCYIFNDGRRFVWDPKKAQLNIKKHHVSFEQAIQVFSDPLSRSKQDRIENGEQRWITIGLSRGYVLLVVAHSVRLEQGGDEIIRIISARRADKGERLRYEAS